MEVDWRLSVCEAKVGFIKRGNGGFYRLHFTLYNNAETVERRTYKLLSLELLYTVIIIVKT